MLIHRKVEDRNMQNIGSTKIKVRILDKLWKLANFFDFIILVSLITFLGSLYYYLKI